MTSGIYIIHNTKNGNIYLGQSRKIGVRWGTHKSTLKHNTHPNRHLQAAWNKYGADAFEFKVLEYCTPDQLDAREQHYLDIYMQRGICYNVASRVMPRAVTEKRRHEGVVALWFRGDKELKERVKAAAERNGMKMQDYIRAVIDYGLNHSDPLFFLREEQS